MLNSPTDVAVDDDYIYIADYGNYRIVKRALSELENIKNISKTNSIGAMGYTSNLLTANTAITTDSQIVLRSGDDLCIYINGVQDTCTNYINIPKNFTFPEINNKFGASAMTTTYSLSENQNYYPWGIGNYGLLTPGNGHIKYLRVFDTNLSDSDINALYYSYK